MVAKGARKQCNTDVWRIECFLNHLGRLDAIIILCDLVPSSLQSGAGLIPANLGRLLSPIITKSLLVSRLSRFVPHEPILSVISLLLYTLTKRWVVVSHEFERAVGSMCFRLQIQIIFLFRCCTQVLPESLCRLSSAL